MAKLGQPTERPRSRARRNAALVLLGALFAAGAFASAVGLASGLPGSSQTLGSSGVATPRCDADGFTVIQNLSGANVISVSVSGIAAGCGGGTMQATFHNGTTSSSGSGTVPGGGGSLTISLAASVPAAVGARVDIVVVGP